MTDPIETRGATGAALANQGLIRPHRAGANWGHRGHGSGPAPLAPPGPNAVGPRNPLKNHAGPTGPTGPTENDVPDVVRAVLAAFEPSAGGDQASQQPPEPSPSGPDLELACDLVEERAAIREHDGGQDRAQVEAAALREVAASLGLDTGQLRRALASGKTH